MSNQIDGQKVFKLSSKFGRTVGLGMDGNKMKLVIHIKGVTQDKWLDILFELVKGLQDVKKENQPINK
jgi:transcription-repair coupling factor (superfamily II helicase)